MDEIHLSGELLVALYRSGSQTGFHPLSQPQYFDPLYYRLRAESFEHRRRDRIVEAQHHDGFTPRRVTRDDHRGDVGVGVPQQRSHRSNHPHAQPFISGTGQVMRFGFLSSIRKVGGFWRRIVWQWQPGNGSISPVQ